MTIKGLDEKIFIYIENRFLNLIYIKLVGDREMKLVLLNWAGKLWSICFFLQVQFRSFLEILETFEKKTVF